MNGLNEYDFSARWMDNAVPGFTTPDPLAELHYSESPYSYCGANPVNRVDPMGLAYFAGDGGAIWREGDNNDTWTDPRTHQKYTNMGDYYSFRTSGGTQTDYKGEFYSFVDDPAPDSKNYYFFNYGSMNGAKDNTGIANNSTTGWENDQNGEKKSEDKKYDIINGCVIWGNNTNSSSFKLPASKYHDPSIEASDMSNDGVNFWAKIFKRASDSQENSNFFIIHPGPKVTGIEILDVAIVKDIDNSVSLPQVTIIHSDGTTNWFNANGFHEKDTQYIKIAVQYSNHTIDTIISDKY